MTSLIQRPSTSSMLDPFAFMSRWLDDDMTMPMWRWANPAITFPRLDVGTDEHGYYIRADLPGLTEDEVDLTVYGNTVVISGKREQDHKVENERYVAYERSYGQFRRQVTLPEGADLDHASARLERGVLDIRVPIKEEYKPRKISVKGIKDRVKGLFKRSEHDGSQDAAA